MIPWAIKFLNQVVPILYVSFYYITCFFRFLKILSYQVIKAAGAVDLSEIITVIILKRWSEIRHHLKFYIYELSLIKGKL